MTMEHSVWIPFALVFLRQQVFNLKWQWKTFLLVPDITSYLTAAGADQTRDLVFKLAPTTTFFPPQLKKKKNVHSIFCADRCFCLLLGVSLYQWAASGTPWSDGAVTVGGGVVGAGDWAARMRHATLQNGRPVCMQQAAWRGLEKPSPGIIDQREMLLPDEYQETWCETCLLMCHLQTKVNDPRLVSAIWCEIQGGKSGSSHLCIFWYGDSDF